MSCTFAHSVDELQRSKRYHPNQTSASANLANSAAIGAAAAAAVAANFAKPNPNYRFSDDNALTSMIVLNVFASNSSPANFVT